MQNVNVKYVSACSHLPNGSLGSSPLRLKSESESSSFQTSYFTVDYDYLKTMDIPLVQGRFFSKNFSNDSTQSILLNESAVKVIGLKNTIGKKVIFQGNSAKTIIGVVKDYHFSS
jgi:putative ABC transport system permease protein